MVSLGDTSAEVLWRLAELTPKAVAEQLSNCPFIVVAAKEGGPQILVPEPREVGCR